MSYHIIFLSFVMVFHKNIKDSVDCPWMEITLQGDIYHIGCDSSQESGKMRKFFISANQTGDMHQDTPMQQ